MDSAIPQSVREASQLSGSDGINATVWFGRTFANGAEFASASGFSTGGRGGPDSRYRGARHPLPTGDGPRP